MLDPWRIPDQQTSSARTSVSALARGFKSKFFISNTVNADIGGGKFDHGTLFLKNKKIENLVFDPFNRSKEFNAIVAQKLQNKIANTASVFNVLNVLDCQYSQDRVIALARLSLKQNGIALFQIYCGDKSGVGKQTICGFQANKKLFEYLPSINQHFNTIKIVDRLIIATDAINFPYKCKDKRFQFDTLEQLKEFEN